MVWKVSISWISHIVNNISCFIKRKFCSNILFPIRNKIFFIPIILSFIIILFFFVFFKENWRKIKNCTHSIVPKWKFIDHSLFLLFHLIRWNLQLLLQTENFTEICGGEIHSRVNTVRRATEECKPRKWFEIENGIAIKLFTGVWRKEIKGSFISATHKNQY